MRRHPPRKAAALLVCAAGLAACGSAETSSAPASAHAATGTAPARSTATPPTAARAMQVAAISDGDWPTFDMNAQRTGVGPSSTGITAANARRLVLRTVYIDGTVDSAPIQLHGITVRGHRRDVVIVTTTYGKTIAIAPGDGQRLWEFTPSDIGRYAGSAQVTTTTPVADPQRHYVYTASPDGFIHKLSVATGAEVRAAGWPARVTGDPAREKLDGALNVDRSSVVVVTGGYYGDSPVYQGHVVLLDRSTGRITRVFNSLCSSTPTLIDRPSRCSDSGSAIWARGGSVVEPAGGNILVATGNGAFNGRTDWGDSVLELSSSLRLLHNWTPLNQSQLDADDEDLGSAGPALVTVGGRRLAVQGGKDHLLHLLDLARLDGTTGPAGPRRGGALQVLGSPGGAEILTDPAVWASGGRTYVFVTDDAGTTAYVAHGGARPGLERAWSTSTPGTSPVVAGGLLYVFDEIRGALDVYRPQSGARVASLPAASGHWNSPIVVGGRVILPVGSYHTHATSGEIEIWRVP